MHSDKCIVIITQNKKETKEPSLYFNRAKPEEGKRTVPIYCPYIYCPYTVPMLY